MAQADAPRQGSNALIPVLLAPAPLAERVKAEAMGAGLLDPARRTGKLYISGAVADASGTGKLHTEYAHDEADARQTQTLRTCAVTDASNPRGSNPTVGTGGSDRLTGGSDSGAMRPVTDASGSSVPTHVTAGGDGALLMEPSSATTGQQPIGAGGQQRMRRDPPSSRVAVESDAGGFLTIAGQGMLDVGSMGDDALTEGADILGGNHRGASMGARTIASYGNHPQQGVGFGSDGKGEANGHPADEYVVAIPLVLASGDAMERARALAASLASVTAGQDGESSQRDLCRVRIEWVIPGVCPHRTPKHWQRQQQRAAAAGGRPLLRKPFVNGSSGAVSRAGVNASASAGASSSSSNRRIDLKGPLFPSSAAPSSADASRSGASVGSSADGRGSPSGREIPRAIEHDQRVASSAAGAGAHEGAMAGVGTGERIMVEALAAPPTAAATTTSAAAPVVPVAPAVDSYLSHPGQPSAAAGAAAAAAAAVEACTTAPVVHATTAEDPWDQRARIMMRHRRRYEGVVCVGPQPQRVGTDLGTFGTTGGGSSAGCEDEPANGGMSTHAVCGVGFPCSSCTGGRSRAGTQSAGAVVFGLPNPARAVQADVNGIEPLALEAPPAQGPSGRDPAHVKGPEGGSGAGGKAGQKGSLCARVASGRVLVPIIAPGQVCRVGNITRERFREIALLGQPVVLTGLDLGPCVARWRDLDYFINAVGRERVVSVHVCYEGQIASYGGIGARVVDLAGHRPANTPKNFAFVDMGFGEFVGRCVRRGDVLQLSAEDGRKGGDLGAHGGGIDRGGMGTSQVMGRCVRRDEPVTWQPSANGDRPTNRELDPSKECSTNREGSVITEPASNREQGATKGRPVDVGCSVNLECPANRDCPDGKEKSGSRECLYMRSVVRGKGKEAARTASDVRRLFPGLAGDVNLGEGLLYDAEEYHSSVLRVTSARTQLWTHYDTMDNVLTQLVGCKRVVLFPPSQEPNMYVEGSSSRVDDVDAPDLDRFPLFARAQAAALECVLHPGDALFIPPLWFHNTTSLGTCGGHMERCVCGRQPKGTARVMPSQVKGANVPLPVKGTTLPLPASAPLLGATPSTSPAASVPVQDPSPSPSSAPLPAPITLPAATHLHATALVPEPALDALARLPATAPNPLEATTGLPGIMASATATHAPAWFYDRPAAAIDASSTHGAGTDGSEEDCSARRDMPCIEADATTAPPSEVQTVPSLPSSSTFAPIAGAATATTTTTTAAAAIAAGEGNDGARCCPACCCCRRHVRGNAGTANGEILPDGCPASQATTRVQGEARLSPPCNASVDPQGESLSVGVNVFWRGLPREWYDRKDIYGNKDLPVAAETVAQAAAVGQRLAALPEPWRSFYGRRALESLKQGLGVE